MKYRTPTLFLAVSIAALTVNAAHASKLETADTDGNGEINISEFRLHAEQKFANTDTNADGVLSEEERQIARAAKRDELKAKRDEMKEKRKSAKAEDSDAAKPRKKDRPNPDSDGDGVISKAEYNASVETRFARLDQNGDGVISEDERAKGRKGPKRPKKD